MTNWVVPRSRYIPTLWPVVTFWYWDVRSFAGVKSTGKIFNIFDRGHQTAVFDQDKFHEVAEGVYKVLDSKKSLLFQRWLGLRAGRQAIKLCKNFSLNLDSAELEDYIKFLDNLILAYEKIERENMFFWFLAGTALDLKITEALKKFSSDDASKIRRIMSQPVINSYSKKEEDEFNTLVKLAQRIGLEDEKVKNEIKKFVAKYFWFPFEYIGPEIWTVESVTKRVQEHLSDALNIHHENLKVQQKACAVEYKLDKLLLRYFKQVQMMTIFQDDRKMINSELCYYLHGKIFRKLAEKLNMSLDKVRFIDQEMIKLSMIDRNEFEKQMNDRLDFLAAEQTDGSYTPYAGQKGREYISSLGIEMIANSATGIEVKGNIAHPGKVSGKVKIMRTSQEKEFNDGEILVTGMTTPDFVPLIKKAGAIVTDEGGITCHAAIVSRELKKPCIIGTKNATRVLKDGDMVEVDANTGIVKKI